MRPWLWVALLLASFAHPAASQGADGPQAYAWNQHPGAQLPLGSRFRDSSGQDRALAEGFGGPPVIFDLGYFHCPTLCGVVRADLMNALRSSGLRPGRDYALVAVSIDPRETPRDAALAKSADLEQVGLVDGSNWHYLTGDEPSIRAVSDAVGFRSRFDPALQQFLHPSGLVVLTAAGRVSAYLMGVGYSGGDLRAAVLRASTGGVAKAALPVLLLCFHFDSATGRYTLAIEKVLRLMGVLTVLTIGGLMVALHRGGARK